MSDNHQIIDPKSVKIAPVQERQNLHPLAKMILDKGDLTPDTLERILDLQERYEASQSRKSFEIARARLTEDLPRLIAKNKKVDFAGKGHRTSYTYADLPQIMRSVIPSLTTHGFFVSWANSRDGCDEVVTCVLSHRDGHSVENTRQAPPDTKGAKSQVQGAQSTVTYLQRQTLLSILGLVTSDAPDADEPKKNPAFIDINRNLRILQRLKKRGIELQEVEGFLLKTLDSWTAKDIEQIANWVRDKNDEDKEHEEAKGET